MIMSRQGVGHAAIVDRQFHAGAVFHLSDGGAIQLLPRRLAGWHGWYALRLAARQFLVGDQHVAAARVQVDADDVARTHVGEAAADGAFRRRVQDRRTVRGAGLAAVAQRRQGRDAAPDQGVRRLHVDHFGRTGPAHRTGAAYHQHAVLVDVQRRVVDARVVVARAVEDDGARLEYVLAAGPVQIALAEGRRDDAGFHDREIEQVAAQDHEAGLLFQRRVIRRDHLGVDAVAAL